MKMKLHLRLAASVAAAVVLVSSGCSVQATGTSIRTVEKSECLGYYTINLPGDFEYALMDRFTQGLGAWGSEIALNLIGLDAQEMSISQPAGRADLLSRMDSRNAERQREIDEVSGRLAEAGSGKEALRGILQEKLSELRLFELIPGRDAIARLDKDRLSIHAVVNGRIFYTALASKGTPAQTLDAFLGHYAPRALGEVPKAAGVCVPYGVFSGEYQPATVGLNLRLKDQPDIVVALKARDASTNVPEDPRKLFDGLTPTATFFGSKRVVPLNRIKPLSAVSIDGSEGHGGFVRVTRKAVADPKMAFNNAAENDEDWGYFAYIPGLMGGKPGDSFNLEFKVERFGRFATRPMSEGEFRELTLRIATSIKRRPGAWVRN